jgi:hypothetical protein
VSHVPPYILYCTHPLCMILSAYHVIYIYDVSYREGCEYQNVYHWYQYITQSFQPHAPGELPHQPAAVGTCDWRGAAAADGHLYHLANSFIPSTYLSVPVPRYMNVSIERDSDWIQCSMLPPETCLKSRWGTVDEPGRMPVR